MRKVLDHAFEAETRNPKAARPASPARPRANRRSA
jgi:hypothetical protein